ncbi:hypothetical protein HYALB_00000671 [Hymenoscyphus albidus]|uniref:Uncharacterized protein n=1 Tax=Hymenoscyphus albidus TaxID=595503 RepID=A0A9N9Q815_9HELO|nr:hypothetical protein HYALB_00000671 [Hymenoscyphus albidus]
MDAKMLRSQLRAGEIFRAFNDSEREDIWSRLQMIEGLIPSFYTLFRDVQYLEHCVNCVKRLTALSPQQTLSTSMKGRFTGVNQRQGQLKVQVAEDKFIYKHGTPQDQVDFGYRQIHAFAMRNWPNMPKEPGTEDPQMKTPIKADLDTLRRFADLAAELGFKSDQITNLQQHPESGNAPTEHPQSRPILVTSGKGVPVKKRCWKPSTREFKEDQQFLFINHLHDERQEQGSSVTSLFVRKSVYLAFFGKPSATHDIGQTDDPPQSVGGSPQASGIHESTFSPNDNTRQSERSTEHSGENYDGILTLYQQREARSEQSARSNITEEEATEPSEGTVDVDSMQDWLEEQERERKEQERLELRRLEETLERDDLNERFTQGLQAQENLEQEKEREQEQKKREHERQEEESRRQETRQQQRREEEARLRERTLKDSERKKNRHTQFDLENLEQGRRDQERLEQERRDQERRDQESLDQERREKERRDQERREQERLHQESREQERQDQEKLDQERRDQESRQQESRQQEQEQAGNQEIRGSELQTIIERQEATSLPHDSPGLIRLTYWIWERGDWRASQIMDVDSSDPSEVKRLAVKYMRKRIRLFDTDFNILTPADCFDAVTAGGKNTILLIPEGEIDISEELEASAQCGQ